MLGTLRDLWNYGTLWLRRSAMNLLRVFYGRSWRVVDDYLPLGAGGNLCSLFKVLRVEREGGRGKTKENPNRYTAVRVGIA